ncbi:response regulator [Candidatus Kaiserbacteria bacterium]|nr:response regulator [Candidatus Kaiserbacteria bacterium]
MVGAGERRVFPYSAREWRNSSILFFVYVAAHVLTSYFVPLSFGIYPAYAVALTGLFFGGLRLAPVVFLAALTADFIAPASELSLIVFPLAALTQAVLGAHALQKLELDPIFRRHRDMFSFMATSATISLIAPTLRVFESALSGSTYTLVMWEHTYVATVFSFLIATPFLLRWYTKPRFSRQLKEALETLLAFTVLGGIGTALFIFDIQSVFGIPLRYPLIAPLFFIALRLRPRFITLAFVMTSMLAIAGSMVGSETNVISDRLFDVELSMIALAASFFIITSLEEDRRVSTNLTLSQFATLENVLARVRSESRAKNDFLAILAHELRNPLAPVVSTIELMRLKGPRDKDERGMLDIMADRMNTVRRLLDDLLDVSRISEGKITIKKEFVNLDSVIQNAVLSTDHYRRELHQNLVSKTHGVPLTVVGDRVRIEQIVSNLLTNASKYSDSGDTITLATRTANGFAEIEVTDEGVGIDAGALEKIFLPFQQVEVGERSMKGLGIGLSLVRNFAEMHGGTVTAVSTGRGHGSRFTVRLPLAQSGETLTRDNYYDSPQNAIAKGLLVLIVDDNDVAAGSIGRLLELQGYRVAYAYDGRGAIQKAINLSPDAILLDIGLPGADGYEVARTLRARGFVGRLVALSGYSGSDEEKRSREAGFDQYLVKPAGLADLRRVLPEL